MASSAAPIWPSVSAGDGAAAPRSLLRVVPSEAWRGSFAAKRLREWNTVDGGATLQSTRAKCGMLWWWASVRIWVVAQSQLLSRRLGAERRSVRDLPEDVGEASRGD